MRATGQEGNLMSLASEQSPIIAAHAASTDHRNSHASIRKPESGLHSLNHLADGAQVISCMGKQGQRPG